MLIPTILLSPNVEPTMIELFEYPEPPQPTPPPAPEPFDPYVFIVPPVLLLAVFVIITLGVNLLDWLFPISRIGGSF